ncbi:MAG: ABC transporter permease [Acidimicrobiia bacterium]|nr:MAG: ABC transporter permease [Acidimicrobiia bacterium]
MVTTTSAVASGGAGGAARSPLVRLTPRRTAALVLASAAGLAMFAWPLLLTPPDGFAHVKDAPFAFALMLPLLVVVVVAELAEGGIDAKAVAMLGVCAAIGAALRPLGAGAAGIETVFFLLVLAGRVYGPGFGYVLGALTLFASALLTAGVGPWLPFQMAAAAWVGLGAGLLPPARGRAEVALCAAYGAVSALAYGFFMNLWFWPFAVGDGTQLSYVPGDAVLANLHRFVLFTIATSSLGWDLGRAVTNVVAITVLGPGVLAALRRAARRASFDARPEFAPADG